MKCVIPLHPGVKYHVWANPITLMCVLRCLDRRYRRLGGVSSPLGSLPPEPGNRFVSCRAYARSGCLSKPAQILRLGVFPFPFWLAVLSPFPFVALAFPFPLGTLYSVHTVQCAHCPVCTLYSAPLLHETTLSQEMCAPLARNHTCSRNVCPSCTKPHSGTQEFAEFAELFPRNPCRRPLLGPPLPRAPGAKMT